MGVRIAWLSRVPKATGGVRAAAGAFAYFSSSAMPFSVLASASSIDCWPDQ
ncbi:hypothetical protein ABIE33_004508 [Ensifer sp. 4252]